MADPLYEINRDIGKIHGLVEGLDGKFDNALEILKDHEIRIKAIELAESNRSGKIAVMSIGVSAMGTIVIAWIKSKLPNLFG